MINWDHAMRRAHATKRVTALAPRARFSFAAGALQHALQHARATEPWRQPDLPLFGALERALSFVWQGLDAAAPARAAKEARREELEAFAPDDDSASLPGQADLVDGVLQLLSLGADPKAKDITSVASFAYQAITAIEIPDVRGGEDAFLKAERSSAACVREIEVQLAYLEALETLGGGDVRWDNVIAHLPAAK
jgi:hypothetical protein